MPGPHGGILATTGTCAYCDASTMQSCRLCGRAICDDHSVEGADLCLDCGSRRAE